MGSLESSAHGRNKDCGDVTDFFQHNRCILALLDALVTQEAIYVVWIGCEFEVVGSVSLGSQDVIGWWPVLVEMGFGMPYEQDSGFIQLFRA